MRVSGDPPTALNRCATSSTTSCGIGRPPVTRCMYSGTSSTCDGVPCANSSTASTLSRHSHLPLRIGVHLVHQRDHVLYRRTRQNPVPQVEDVSGAPACLIEHVARALPYGLLISEQHHRIEIPLYRHIMPQHVPPAVQLDAPIQSDHVCARAFHVAQQRRGIRAEINDRHP